MKLLEHFHELSIYPKNAKKLKGLILQLAVQGKLTAEWRKDNPDVEPASALLEKIKAEKAQLIKEKKIRKEQPLLEITGNEIPYKLPDSWAWCRLRDLVSILGDGIHGTPEYTLNGPVYFVNGNNLTDGIIEIKSHTKTVSIEECLKHKRELNDRTVLVSINGTIGNTALYNSEKVMLGKSACYFNLLSELNKEYIRQLIKTKYFLDYAFDSATGTTIKNVSLRTMREFIVPLPPISEQKAIVTIVEQLFKEVEQLEQLTVERIELKEKLAISALNQISIGDTRKEWAFLQQHFTSFFNEESNIKKLRETILQLAVQGKLTDHWRKANPELIKGEHSAKALLEQIKKEKAALLVQGKIKKEKPMPPILEDDIPYKLPDEWVWCRLREITKLITKGSSPKWQGVQYVEQNDKGILFITSENVGCYNLLMDKRKYVESKFNKIEPRSILQKDDILMNIVGGSIGRTAIFDLNEVANINQAVTIIRLIPGVNYQYFLHFFNSPICVEYMYDKQVDNARPNLSMGNIAKFKIPLPTLNEQKAIVEKVNTLMTLCDSLEQQVKQSNEDVEQLMKAVLREVFEGEYKEVKELSQTEVVSGMAAEAEIGYGDE